MPQLTWSRSNRFQMQNVLTDPRTFASRFALHSCYSIIHSFRAAYYFQKGSDGNNTWVFMLEGGGLCSHQDDCTQRSTTDLGSSKNFAKQIDLPSFQAQDSRSNPDWYNANQVFIPYCTGDVHGGTRTEPNEWGFYFSGHHVVSAVVEDLKKNKGLDAADLVIFSGDSAGGMGVITNVDFVASQIPSAKVLGVPIGGFIFAHPNYVGDGAVIESENARARDFEYDAELFQGFTSRPYVLSLSLSVFM